MIRSSRAASLAPFLLLALVSAVDSIPAQTLRGDKPKVGPAPGPSHPGRKPGVRHVLQQGQTLYSLSRAYGVPVKTLVEANRIADPTRIPAGKTLFIPGVLRPLSVPPPAPPGIAFSWPVAGVVTSPFETDGRRPHHEGIDIGGVMGEEVRAAAAGRVVSIGTERGYGKMLIIDHGEGLSTLYAHASEILVEVDQEVEAGTPVARVGNSGNARGAHLHFEIHRDGRPVNPLPYLPGPGPARAAQSARE